MYFTKQADGFRAHFVANQGNGSLRTGLLAGDFTVTVVDPADGATITPAVSESTQKAGLYFFDITTGFITTNGAGDYGVVVEVDTFAGPSGAPHVRDAFGEVLRVTAEDFDTLAQPGDAMDLVANAVDAAAIATDAIDADAIAADAIGASELATDAVNEIRDSILADSTPFNGANIDAAISSRAVPGDLMGLTAGAINGVADQVWDESAAGHATAGSMGELQNRLDVTISSRAVPGDAMALTAGAEGAVVDAVWDEAAAAHNAAGSMGERQNFVDQLLSATESNIRGADSRDLTELAGAGFTGATDSLEAIRDAISDVSNTVRFRASIPELVRPEAGSLLYRLTVTLEDTNGNPEDPDADTINVAARDASGGNLDANLSATTMTRLQQGVYEVVYTVASTHGDGQVRFQFTYAENAVAFFKEESATIIPESAIAPTVQQIVDGVWDEPLASHLAAGSTGEALDGAGGASAVTPAQVADAVWDESQADHKTAGTMGGQQSEIRRRIDGVEFP